MNDWSGPVEEFLNFFRESERAYHMSEAEEQEAWAGVLDVHHDIELTEHTEAERRTENRIYTPRGGSGKP